MKRTKSSFWKRRAVILSNWYKMMICMDKDLKAKIYTSRRKWLIKQSYWKLSFKSLLIRDKKVLLINFRHKNHHNMHAKQQGLEIMSLILSFCKHLARDIRVHFIKTTKEMKILVVNNNIYKLKKFIKQNKIRNRKLR